MKTQDEIKAYLDELEVEFDYHDETLDEPTHIGREDALKDTLDPDRAPYGMDDMKETIKSYMGYLRSLEWMADIEEPWTLDE